MNENKDKLSLMDGEQLPVCREQIRQFYNKTALEHLCVREKSSVGGYMT